MPPGNKTTDSDLESVLSLNEARPKPRRNSLEPKYYCSINGCGAQFKRLDHLDRHEYHHTGIKKHACLYDGCNKEYSIVTHLKRHLRTIHERVSSPQKNVACSIESCGKLFRSVCNMQRHIREVHENPKVYHCGHCGEKFKQKLKMRRHEITKHTAEFPYSCDKCAKGFYQKWQYERHLPICKVYPCPNCSLQFEKWTLYLKHCKETQHGRKAYKCEHCPSSYAKPGELQKHTAAKHFDDEHKMVYKCTYEGCERSYTYERNLRQHLLTTHGGKRFECKVEGCESVFSSGQNLTKHMERDHKPGAAVKPKKSKAKGMRKKRKDAGQSTVSNLVKLSGLAVEKEFDNLLREREQNALTAVSTALVQRMETDVESEKSFVEMAVSAIAVDPAADTNNKEKEFGTLVEIALQDF